LGREHDGHVAPLSLDAHRLGLRHVDEFAEAVLGVGGGYGFHAASLAILAKCTRCCSVGASVAAHQQRLAGHLSLVHSPKATPSTAWRATPPASPVPKPPPPPRGPPPPSTGEHLPPPPHFVWFPPPVNGGGSVPHLQRLDEGGLGDFHLAELAHALLAFLLLLE